MIWNSTLKPIFIDNGTIKNNQKLMKNITLSLNNQVIKCIKKTNGHQPNDITESATSNYKS